MTSRIKEFLGKRSGKTVAIIIGAVLAASAVYAGYRLIHQPPRHKGAARLDVDLRNPEFLLVTRNLSRLPKDVADAPALAGLVDEQLVFHYEEDEARLSMEGTIRRLAYEHDLDLNDRFLATLLAAPAEVVFWRGAKGRPEYFIASVERGTLGKLSQAIAKIVSSDRQLKLAAKLSVNGDSVPFYTLSQGGGRNLAFAGVGDRWVVLSDPRLAIDEQGEFSDAAATILGDLLRGRHPWADRLPHAANAEHSVVVGAKALTMDYAHFLPALTAFRFDHDGKQWRAAIRLDQKAHPEIKDVTSIWRAVPGDAALCAALPVHWPAAQKPLQALVGDASALPALLAALDPVGAICWYPNSRLSSPLFVARAQGQLPPESAPLLANLAQKAWAKDGKLHDGGDKGESQRLVSTVPSVHGSSREGNTKVFKAALARRGNLIFFSPDERNVDAALKVAAKHAPALGDEAGVARGAWLAFDPARLGTLLRTDIQDVLPQDDEAFFRGVARSALWPRLDDWGQRQQAGALVPAAAGGDGFVPLELTPLRSAKP